MAVPGKIFTGTATAVGITLVDYTHASTETVALYFPYASFSAALVVKCIVTLNNVVVDTVFAGAGGSHSWWDGAGGPFLDAPLQPGDHLVVTAISMTPANSDCAIRFRFSPVKVGVA